LGVWRRVATGTGIASACTREGKGVCCLRFTDFREGTVGDEGLDEREESLSRKGSKELVEFVEEITVASACRGICCNCGWVIGECRRPCFPRLEGLNENVLSAQ
jgi:hypothetical protein